MIIRKRAYYDTFSCIAAACPDSCCKEWEVAVDEASAVRYRSLPGELGERLREVLYDEDGNTYMAIQEGRCPMWRKDGLCRIQAELGEEALCCTCREFPRLKHDYGNFVEYQLELSCPEAARILLNAPAEPMEVLETPEAGTGDYDREAMEVLLRTRQQALALLKEGEAGRALALLLLYTCQAQGELDGEEAMDFDPESALESAAGLRDGWNPAPMLEFFAELEILTPQWQAMLDHPQPGDWHPGTLALARYLVERYWLQAVSDYDLYCRGKLVVILCLLAKQLGGDFVCSCQRMSKEIENNTENLETLLEAAYSHGAFTDARLLTALLES